MQATEATAAAANTAMPKVVKEVVVEGYSTDTWVQLRMCTVKYFLKSPIYRLQHSGQCWTCGYLWHMGIAQFSKQENIQISLSIMCSIWPRQKPVLRFSGVIREVNPASTLL